METECDLLDYNQDWRGSFSFPTQLNVNSSSDQHSLKRPLPTMYNVDMDEDVDDDNISIHSRNSNHSVSTSGVSSLLPHEPTKAKRPKLCTAETVTLPNSIHDQSNISLFSNKPVKSVFYRGLTSYGGASSSSCKDNAPLRYQMVVNQGTVASSAILSSTARRILENMERCETRPNPCSRLHSNYPCERDSVQAKRYPPYTSAFNRFKKLQSVRKIQEEQQRNTVLQQNTVSEIEDALPVPSEPDVIEPVKEIFSFKTPDKLQISTREFAPTIKIYNFCNPQILTHFQESNESQTLPPKPVVSDIPVRTFTPEPIWRCVNCLIEVPQSKSFCSKCFLPRQSAESFKLDKTLTSEDEQKWTCLTCLVPNKTEHMNCVCCQVSMHTIFPSKLFLRSSN
ncbi:hypothetical protein Ciccas_008954 [Cichlidogyrus casuarinus]|uniref:RanBP2-type domain-containing protein n=1 Tax=Cichlidogyrus casuarinus TaxID=1844966 RepID=A0ABD2PYN1_9PLAT